MNKKNIVIIGGTGFLGKNLIKDLKSKVNKIIIGDLFINEENDNEYKIDITSEESIINFIKVIKKTYKKIDVVINTAYPRNKNYGNHFFDVKYSDFCENVNLHLGGYFLISQKFAELFIEQKYGNIINISSIYGVVAPDFSIYENTKMTLPIEYSCIKSAMIMLDKYLSNYLKNKNIRVNTISPGGLLANQDPIFLEKYGKKCINKGMLDPSDISGTVAFLISDDSKYINGQNIIVDDGFCN